jgi:hypothetical protein
MSERARSVDSLVKGDIIDVGFGDLTVCYVSSFENGPVEVSSGFGQIIYCKEDLRQCQSLTINGTCLYIDKKAV